MWGWLKFQIDITNCDIKSWRAQKDAICVINCFMTDEISKDSLETSKLIGIKYV